MTSRGLHWNRILNTYWNRDKWDIQFNTLYLINDAATEVMVIPMHRLLYTSGDKTIQEILLKILLILSGC